MVKLGKVFSILVVFTLLILLAPAVVLPGQNVAQADLSPVTEEIEANFNFSVVDSGGEWHEFNAGSGGVEGTPKRLILMQYTREAVVMVDVSARVPGSGFRNYTTGSGTVNSTLGNLNGTLTLEWITIRFNKTYTHSPKYDPTATDFGWMSGRGHYYDYPDTANNFTFVFVADLDCDDDMTNAEGRGWMVSVEENGRFGSMSEVQELRHKVIGDFDIALSGGFYTGNFTLRNYPPNEVYNVGVLNISGGVLQEPKDDIHSGLELLNMTTDGPMFTPVDPGYLTGFEEVDWGRDPTKHITASDRLGINGTMDIARNSALYLNQSKPLTITYIRIAGVPVCCLHIDDTYDVTGDDGSAYGKLWQILLLTIPYCQKNVVDRPNEEYFNQDGYSFTPFGTVNGQPTSATGCYAGAESFALANISIEVCAGTALQKSTDITYGMYPHPNVDKVFPSNGFANTTMDVKIRGKYLLRAEQIGGNISSTGSVDFGPNITVNSYTVDSAEQITVNITIDDVSAGTEVVNVTSCFGYQNGNGTAPYKSGLGNFNIVTAGGTLEGNVTPGRIEMYDMRAFERDNVPKHIWKAFESGEFAGQVWAGTGTTNVSGVFNISDVLPETYDIAFKNWSCLSEVVTNVTVTGGATTPLVDFGTIRVGDANNNDAVNIMDLVVACDAFGAEPEDDNWDPNCDFNRNDKVNIMDLVAACDNFGDKGALNPYG